MPEALMKIEITRGLLRGAWAAFFIVGFFYLVSLIVFLRILRSLNLQLDFLVYIKSLLQEIRRLVAKEEGGDVWVEGKEGEPPPKPRGGGPPEGG